ncbi:MAG: 50S ribosomal protein L23 [Endomicrobium sp.]|jgi:large subunit ribosomal protein L23|nr:50S ribosomal protein L23 [Endomicrobium sp.]
MDIRNIIKRSVVTEKAVLMKEKDNKYTFAVDKSANKFQIKYAVETLFNVKVKSVHTSNCVGKSLKVGRYTGGYKSDWKKAIVKLDKGQEIQLTDGD